MRIIPYHWFDISALQQTLVHCSRHSFCIVTNHPVPSDKSPMQKYSFIEHVMLEYICTYLFDSIGQISSSEINLFKSSCTMHNLKC